MATELERTRTQDEMSFRALAEMIPQLVWSTRENGTIVYANGRFLEYFGIRREALASWWLADNVHPDDGPAATTAWRTALEAGAPYEVEYRLRAAAGDYHWFLARGTPFRDPEQRVAGWFGTSTPIDRQLERLERQRRIVEAFQAAFVPRPLPAILGLRLDGAYFAADEHARVGGDWYDALALDERTVLISVGDVMGHGVAAAVSMAKIRQAIVAAAVGDRDPAAILTRADQVVWLLEPAVATAVVAVLDLVTGRLRVALAGHPPPIIASPAATCFMAPGGIPLGVDPGALYETVEHQLVAGELMVFYTDGLTEAHRTIEEDEGRLLLAARGAASGRLDAAGIRSAVIGETRTADDVAILTVRLG
jgi:PAS domain S-box-containing protein